MEFLGREKEIKILRESLKKAENRSQLTTIKGQRRVGKTRLVSEAYRNSEHPFVYFYLKEVSENRICEEFSQVMKRSLGVDFPVYEKFEDSFKAAFELAKEKPITLVIDEIQNIRYVNPSFFHGMQEAWDFNHLDSHLNLIVCGSVLTDMREIFENYDQPMYNRGTSYLTLNPLKPEIIQKELLKQNPEATPEDLLMYYAVTGGVPAYMEDLENDSAFTADRMVDSLFEMDSRFKNEGEQVIINEFREKYKDYFKIIYEVARGHNKSAEIHSRLPKMEKKEIDGYLLNLEEKFHIIGRVSPFDGKGDDIRYEITDNYLNLWFRFAYGESVFRKEGIGEAAKASFLEAWPAYSGKILERWYKDKFRSRGMFNVVDTWRGESPVPKAVTENGKKKFVSQVTDLDLVARKGKDVIIAEIKKDPKRIDMKKVMVNSMNFIKAEDLDKVSFAAFSMKDMFKSTDELEKMAKPVAIGRIKGLVTSEIKKVTGKGKDEP